MQNKMLNIIKATILKLIVAFLFVVIVFGLYKVLLEEKFETVAGLIDVFTVNNEVYGKATPDMMKKVIEEYRNM